MKNSQNTSEQETDGYVSVVVEDTLHQLMDYSALISGVVLTSVQGSTLKIVMPSATGVTVFGKETNKVIIEILKYDNWAKKVTRLSKKGQGRHVKKAKKL